MDAEQTFESTKTQETERGGPRKTTVVKPAEPAAKRPFFHRPGVVKIGAVVLLLAIVYVATVIVHVMTHQTTDDAFIDGHVISVAPKVAGKVHAVLVNDNQFVKKDDVLVEIDPSDLEAVAAQRRAELRSAQASAQQAEAHLKTVDLATKIAKASADATQASTQLSHSDLTRNLALIKTGAISAQDYEHTKSAAQSADANLESKQREVDAANAYTAEAQAAADSAEAKVNQAKAALDQAELQLSYTKIKAPQDGRVTSKAVEAGDYIQVGQALLAVVPADVWVTANFKETQITDMHPGQTVDVDVDAYPGRPLKAHVDSIQAGSGARFSLLPPENATGNFVKVVQRVPVKIVFNEDLDTQRVLGPGMSAVPEVRVKDALVPAIVVGIFALIACVAVIFLAGKWLRKVEAE